MTLLDRFLRRDPARKAVYGGPALVAYQSDISLAVFGSSYQERAAQYLRAYKCGWFYKAGSRISRDIANLPFTLAYEDTEGDNAEAIVAPANNVPFEALDPLEQFLRLWERPNPYQTGRQLKQKTEIRLDFAGRAFVYLENGDAGLPSALYGISPTRMWPSVNARGELIGWVMDKDRNGGGVPFTPEEILVIEYPSSDDDPIGVVEAVYAHVPLSTMIAKHTADVLATGGRLAGMAWPKDRALTEAEYADAQRAWRNVASDPNAARRLLLFPEPMEYEKGAATPTEIGIPDLATLSRDEILTAFPISPYMLGVPMPGGLDSGEVRREERHDYWEGSIHPRVEIWEDAIQQALIPRYEAVVGRPLDFDIEEPNLDDAPTIIEKVGAYKGLVSIGFDPKEAVAAVGLDHVKWNGLPPTLDPANQQATQGDGLTATASDTSRSDASVTQQRVVGKAKETRDDIMGRMATGSRASVRSFLLDQRERLAERVREVAPMSKAARMKAFPDDWWDGPAEDAAFLDRLREVYVSIGRGALQVVADNTGRTVLKGDVSSVLDALLRRSGSRISEINETTRQAIADTIADGVRRGYSISQLVDGVPAESFGGVRNALLANGVPAFDDLRAETIARTETMLAYNESALLGYGHYGVSEVEAIDGDGDPECAARHGLRLPIDEALGITDHPNGTLDWIPVIPEAA